MPSPLDLVGYALVLLGVGFVLGVLVGYGRGFQVFRKHLREHIQQMTALHLPTLEENERLKREGLRMGAQIERQDREIRLLEQSLAEYVDEITGLHHALEAREEADSLADLEEQREKREQRRRAAQARKAAQQAE